VTDAQWVRRVEASGPRYLFGRLDQKTAYLTGRLDLTFLPDLTLQLYAQPFLSAGSYTELKQVADPRARAYRNRFLPLLVTREGESYRADLDGDGTRETFPVPDFDVRQFRSTLVLRWEYRPGSLLYLVWSQGRDSFDPDGRFRLLEGTRELFGEPARDVFMLKASYWITP
jgi:hypothetical protein